MSDGTWYQVNDDGTTTPLSYSPPGAWFAYPASPIPEEAYGRVTNPERYRVLHTAARELLDRLATSYAVDREDGDAALDPALADRFADAAEAVVRLTPRSPAAAPLTVVFTSFPGLALRLGDWVVEALPSCGCDACDEGPDDLVGLLTGLVEALVAGDFTERRAGDAVAYRLGDQEVSHWPADTPPATPTDPPAEHHWSPWPPTPT